MFQSRLIFWQTEISKPFERRDGRPFNANGKIWWTISALGGSPSKEETEQKKLDAINEGKEPDLQIEMARMMNNMMPITHSLPH